MKCEIKFRGKRIDNGEWVYGSYTHCQDGEGHTSIIPFRANYHVPVDPETVGQYTGLKDRNGKEIYEGDIVQTETISYSESGHFNGMIKVKGAVFYDSGKYQAQYTDHTIRGLLFGLNYHEVIGNRWDNPDLLEGEKI
ncbi:hypothetical protein GTY77_18190 [Streptomyces sp. SID8380]|nr:hypothetical protein [Streptomyces sp. SID8380]